MLGRGLFLTLVELTGTPSLAGSPRTAPKWHLPPEAGDVFAIMAE